MSLKPLIISIFLHICANISFAQVEIGYALKQGDTFKIKQVVQQRITQKADDSDKVITNNLDGIFVFNIIEQIDSTYKIKFWFEDLNLSMRSNSGETLLTIKAREKQEGNLQSCIYNSVLNNPIVLYLEKDGNISKVENTEAFIENIISATGVEDESTVELIKSFLNSEYGDKSIINSYNQVTFIYPKEKVAIGDSWTNTYKGKLSADNLWTLKSVMDEEIKIVGNSKVELNSHSQNTQMLLKGSQTTKITSDLKTGFLKFISIESFAEGVSQILNLNQDNNIPTTIQSTTTYELL